MTEVDERQASSAASDVAPTSRFEQAMKVVSVTMMIVFFVAAVALTVIAQR